MTVDRVLVHHSGTADGPTASWPAIRKYHTTPVSEGGKGWVDIGYHCGVELLGDSYEVLKGRDEDMNGAHCPGQNDRALGICLVGNFNLAQPPAEQLRVAARHVAFWCRHYRIPTTEIYPHNAFSDTDCPGDWFDIEQFRSMVAEDVY